MNEIIDLRIEQREKLKEQEKKEDTEDDLEVFVRAWERDFDRMNPNPEDNSDFDSDNDINPIDSVNQDGKYFASSRQQISSDNAMKKKPIQISIVGKPNIGKSTLINALLKEHRVVANDMPGTTRDSVMSTWSFQGRRIQLVDTAGIKPGSGLAKTVVDLMVND